VHAELLLQAVEAAGDIELVGAGVVGVSEGAKGGLAMEVESSWVGLAGWC
jgi:hypothetical protein